MENNEDQLEEERSPLKSASSCSTDDTGENLIHVINQGFIADSNIAGAEDVNNYAAATKNTDTNVYGSHPVNTDTNVYGSHPVIRIPMFTVVVVHMQ